MPYGNSTKILGPICLLLMVFSIGATQLRLDFSQSSYVGGDLIEMLPLPAWIFLFLFLPITVTLICRFNKRLSWSIPFSLIIVLVIIFQLIQYPNVFHWDVFFHSSTAQNMANPSASSVDTGYAIYPGAFMFSAIFSSILGIPVLISSILLASIVVFLIMFLLFSIGRLLENAHSKIAEASWLVPSLFLVFDFNFFNATHYSPQLVGLFLYILLVYVCIKNSRLSVRAWNIIILLLLSVLTITHVFSGVIALTTILCIYIGGTKVRAMRLYQNQSVALYLLLFAAILFVSWHLFIATRPFEQVVDFLSALLQGERTLSRPDRVILASPFSGFLMPFLNFYHYGIYLLFGFVSALGLASSRQKAEVKLIFWFSIGVLLGGFATYLTPAVFGVGRILLLYGGVIVAILSVYAIAKQDQRFCNLTINQVFKALKAILPFLVIGTFLVENLFTSTYVSFVHSDEIAAVRFASFGATQNVTAVVDYSYIFSFYLKKPLAVLSIDEHASPNVARDSLENAELSLQYMPRQFFYYNLSFVEGSNNQIYSNGLTRIYAKGG